MHENRSHNFGMWGGLSSEFCERKPALGAFDLEKLIRAISQSRSDKLDNGHFHYTVSLSQDNFNVRFRTRYHSHEGAVGWDYGDLARISAWYRARVKCHWSSDGFGDWEGNSGPFTIGVVRAQTKLKEWSNYERITESLLLELWQPVGTVPACRVTLNATYDSEQELTLTRQDYTPRTTGLWLRVPYVRDFLWKQTGKPVDSLPTDLFLREWAMQRYTDAQASNANTTELLNQT